MALIADDILTPVAEILLDETNVRWPAAGMLRSLNEAKRVLVTKDARAGTRTVTVKLQPGVLQTLPADGRRILDMPRNCRLPPPVAAFTPAPASGAAPLAVQFTDASTGIVTGWAWDFDSSGTVDATNQNPQHTYEIGNFEALLTVTGPGGSSSVSHSISVTSCAGQTIFDAAHWSGPWVGDAIVLDNVLGSVEITALGTWAVNQQPADLRMDVTAGALLSALIEVRDTNGNTLGIVNVQLAPGVHQLDIPLVYAYSSDQIGSILVSGTFYTQLTISRIYWQCPDPCQWHYLFDLDHWQPGSAGLSWNGSRMVVYGATSPAVFHVNGVWANGARPARLNLYLEFNAFDAVTVTVRDTANGNLGSRLIDARPGWVYCSVPLTFGSEDLYSVEVEVPMYGNLQVIDAFFDCVTNDWAGGGG